MEIKLTHYQTAASLDSESCRMCTRINFEARTPAQNKNLSRGLFLSSLSADSRSGLAEILGRLAGFVCLEQMICKCHAHGRFHVRQKWYRQTEHGFRLSRQSIAAKVLG